MENQFPMVAKTFQGLEDVLRDELIALGAHDVELGQRMVSFEGDLELMYRANLCCRTALRILKPIVKFTACNPDELYSCVRDIEWEKYMGVDSTFSVDSTVTSTDFTHSKFVAYRVKDGIADHFNDRYGRRPSVRLSGADVQLNVHIFENRVTISLDSSGESLCKRGYKVANTDAPINEVLAAGIILKTGWRGDCDFTDPMCGSGTFLTEAALIAANINPGIYREHFAFEKWADFDRELFEELYNDDSAEREFAYKIYGNDIDPEAIAIARRNVRSAKVEDMVELSCGPMADMTENAPEGVMVTNPPYGQRLKADDMTALYKGIGTALKNNFKGWHAWIIGYRDEDMKFIGLKPSVKIPLMNGNLECSLREYVLFEGGYDSFREEGGSIGNLERARLRNNVKVHRMSDREWEEDARRYEGGRPRRADRYDGKKGDRRTDRERDRDRKSASRSWGFEGGRHNDRPFRRDAEEGEEQMFRPERKFSGERPERKFSGERPERKSSGGRPERKFSGERPERKSSGERPDRKFSGGRPDRKFSGERPERKFSGERPERKFSGERPERKSSGERPERKSSGERPHDIIPGSASGPKLPQESEVRFSDAKLRSRRKK